MNNNYPTLLLLINLMWFWKCGIWSAAESSIQRNALWKQYSVLSLTPVEFLHCLHIDVILYSYFDSKLSLEIINVNAILDRFVLGLFTKNIPKLFWFICGIRTGFIVFHFLIILGVWSLFSRGRNFVPLNPIAKFILNSVGPGFHPVPQWQICRTCFKSHFPLCKAHVINLYKLSMGIKVNLFFSSCKHMQ